MLRCQTTAVYQSSKKSLKLRLVSADGDKAHDVITRDSVSYMERNALLNMVYLLNTNQVHELNSCSKFLMASK